jgi:GAF domain-containing protein
MKQRGRTGRQSVKRRDGSAIGRKARKVPTARAPNGLQNQLDRATRERNEALEQLAATSEVLQVIGTTPGDLEPVFQSMLANAVRICEAKFGTLYRTEGDSVRCVAMHGVPKVFTEERRRAPVIRPAPTTTLARALATKRPVQTADVRDYPDAPSGYTSGALAKLAGARTLLTVPMLKENEPIGAIVIYRTEVRPFTDKQIGLVKNFAAQAVIAIENTRLLNELRQRTDDLTDSLEQQTATSEVLKVISSSPGELKPVFEAMLANATRICEAKFGILYLTEGDAFRTVALYGAPPAFAEARQREPLVRAGPGISLHQAAITRQPVQVADIQAEPAYTNDPQRFALLRLAGARTVLSVPLLKENEVLGVIVIYRQEVRPFSEKEIDLVKNFASQAVIAIENTRLLNELRQRTDDLSEALEYQTATSEVLNVISRSPNELRRVLDTILQTAGRLCEADYACFFKLRDGKYHVAAANNAEAAYVKFLLEHPISPDRTSCVGRAAVERRTVHMPDCLADPEYKLQEYQRVGKHRSLLGVPLLRDGVPIAVIGLLRAVVKPFTSKQIELVTTFADQALIAIENVRLFEAEQARTRELSESLEQQTATSEVLKVISSSPSDLRPVFQSMLENSVRICEAKFGQMFLCEGDKVRAVAQLAVPAALVQEDERRGAFQPSPEGGLMRAILTKHVIHINDIMSEQPSLPVVKLGGARSYIAVPMLKESELLGVIVIYRQEVRPFTEKQIDLVKNFAAQAVIAIENARLLDDLNKLNQQLEQRVTDQVSEIERMGKLRRFLPPQVADLIVASGTEKQLESHRREITALFCDLRGFTGFSESSDPEDVMALLREYHAAIGEIINKYGGTLERYAGDGVMVVFNDPIPVDNPALQAVLMAIDMRGAIGELIEKRRKLGHDIGFGIGIAHGFATLGTIGFEGRFDYAAIGTVSNVASRLCDEAKPGQILISPRVLMAVEKDITVEPVGDFVLKGIRRPLTAYNVLEPTK